MAGHVEVKLLGGFAVTVNGSPVPGDAWRSRRAADLVKILSLSPARRMHREQAMEALWPEGDAESSAANLRKAVHFARRALGGDSAIVNSAGILSMWPDMDVTVDVVAFEAAAVEAIESRDPGACAAAADLFGGPLLPDDIFEGWAVQPRERLRLRSLEVLRAGGLWRRLAEADPTDEEAARALMRAHLDAGERREAIRRFEVLREALNRELGVGPDPATVALYEEVLAVEGSEPPTPAQRAHALLAWALVHWNRKDLDQAEQAATEARALALGAGLGRELGESATVLALVAMARGTWRERFLEEFTESVRLRADMEPIVFDAHLCFAEYYLTGPEGYDAAARFAEHLLEVARQAGSRTGEALSLLLMGEAALLSGRLDDAEATLKRAAQENDREGCVSGTALAHQRLAECSLARGRRWEAGRLLSRARSLAQRSDIASHLVVRVLGTMIEAAQDPSDGLRVLKETERDLAPVRACEPCSVGYHLSAATAGARGGDIARGHLHLEQAERISAMWQGGPWLGAVWEARGAVRAAEGDHEQARAMYREAAAAFERAGDERRARRSLAAAE